MTITAIRPARLSALILTALTTLGAVTVSATPAGAATTYTRPCVSRAEYRQVHRGMTQTRVHAIFDFRGALGEASQHYRACGGRRTVVIVYTFDAPRRVRAKYRVVPIANGPLAP